jgi:hypothetical protein
MRRQLAYSMLIINQRPWNLYASMKSHVNCCEMLSGRSRLPHSSAKNILTTSFFVFLPLRCSHSIAISSTGILVHPILLVPNLNLSYVRVVYSSVVLSFACFPYYGDHIPMYALLLSMVSLNDTSIYSRRHITNIADSVEYEDSFI